MSRTILSLHAHPDDESSKGAGTVARLVSEGVRAVLVTATGGEAGEILNSAMDRPDVVESLAKVRKQELAEAASIIGYDEVVMLGYRDSGMPDSADNAHDDAFCNQPLDAILERVVEIVRHEQPDVVLGYDAHEFYPHPDHLRVHELSMRLVDAAADPTRFPTAGEPWQVKKLYAPLFTGARLRALHDAMVELTGESPYASWIDRLEQLPQPERRIMQFDTTGFVQQGRDALRAHRTQVDPDGFWFAVPTHLVESVYPWEDFEVLSTEQPWDPNETHLFEGIE
ncbi:MAG: mycothiol conjugate amidase Mca [Acidimicrobiia bacterium]|nr:MAG: mycothiol conjugate amidase Mca [Acidimicrobiia bacterium]